MHWSKFWTPKTLLSCPSHLVWSAGPANWPTWLKPYPCPPSHGHSLNQQTPQGRHGDKGHHRDHGYHGHQLKNQRNATAFSNRHWSNNEIQLAMAKSSEQKIKGKVQRKRGLMAMKNPAHRKELGWRSKKWANRPRNREIEEPYRKPNVMDVSIKQEIKMNNWIHAFTI